MTRIYMRAQKFDMEIYYK